MPRLLTIIGTRPQYIKYAAMSAALREAFDETLVDTGQHYDYALAGIFRKELHLPTAATVLDAGGGHPSAQLSRMLEGLHGVFENVQPDLVLTFGDTTSTMAAAISATQHGTPLAHIEAGERSRDAAGRRIPAWSAAEEMHRITTDHASSLLLCATESAAETLRQEHVRGSVILTGDIMYDIFLREGQADTDILTRLELEPSSYVYCTVHRQINTDSPERLRQIFDALAAVEMPVVLPLHPRTSEAASRFGLLPSMGKHGDVRRIEPVGYAHSITLARNAARIITDSGGLTREAYFCGIPSICVDDSTAWHMLCEAGWCSLAGADKEAIGRAMSRNIPLDRPPFFGTGDAVQRSVAALREFAEFN